MPTAAEHGVDSRLSRTRRPLSLDVPVRVGDDVELPRVRHVTFLGGVAAGKQGGLIDVERTVLPDTTDSDDVTR